MADNTSDTKWGTRFFLIWTGQAFSLFGSALEKFALIWWLTLETGRATTLAVATIVSFAPIFVIGPFAGVFADRMNRRLVLVFSDGVIALGTAVLVLLFFLGRANTQSIYLVMFVRATGDAFHKPTMQASTTMMVPKKNLLRISSLKQLVTRAANFGAPPLAAFLLLIANV